MPFLLCISIGVLLAPWFSLQPIMGIAGGLFLLFSSWEFDVRELTTEFPLIIKLWLGAFLFPFFSGFALPYFYPKIFMGLPYAAQTTTAFILGIAMAVSAVPVVLKIMQELGWNGTLRARRVILTAILCDLVAWLLFLPLLPSNGQTSWITGHFPLFMFFIGLACTYLWPGLTKSKKHLNLINQWIVAPVFFIGVGQNLNFSQGYNFNQMVLIFIVATLSKTIGVWLAARSAGIERDDCNALAIALNARGAMEIVMANFALRGGLINHELFLSLVVMALGTSLIIKPIWSILQSRIDVNFQSRRSI